MTELIKLRPIKTTKPRRRRRRRSHKRSYTFKTGDASSDSSDEDDDSSSNDESPLIFQLPSKTSKRNNRNQTLPIINSPQSVKEKKKRHQPPIQQFLINNQPSSPKKKEIVINQIIELPYYPQFPYEPILARTPQFSRIIERDPYMYPRAYTPDFIDEYPYSPYSFREPPMRRIVRVAPLNTKSVHLPQHAKKLVNRFLNGMEHAHGCRHCDGNDSDCSIDDCTVCHRLRSAMNGERRTSYSDIGLYRGSRALFGTQNRHYHDHSNDCKVCNLLERSDLVISSTKDYPKKKKNKHVHVVESYPSNIKEAVETTTTTTTTTTQPKVAAPVVPTIPVQSSYYPMTYSNYVDPNTGLTYSYGPNRQYDPSGAGVTYNYSPYYPNPGHAQSDPQYAVATDSSIPLTQQNVQTTTMVSPNSFIDKGTYTKMRRNRKKRKPVNKTVVIHTSRNLTPPTPKIIIEQRPARLPRKLQSTTILKERTTQTPHRSTTTYAET